RTLEEWVRMTIESKQLARGQNSAPPFVFPVPEAPSANPSGPRMESFGTLGSNAESGSAIQKTTNIEPAPAPKRGADTTTTPPPAASEPGDPYDPSIFNRQMHSGKK